MEETNQQDNAPEAGAAAEGKPGESSSIAASSGSQDTTAQQTKTDAEAAVVEQPATSATTTVAGVESVSTQGVGEAGNAGAPESAADASTEAGAAAQFDPAPAGDGPNAAGDAAPTATGAVPALPAGAADGTSGTGESLPADVSFEQRVEARFLKLERALLQLPHSIRTVMDEGSHEVEEFTQRVLSHLFNRI